MTWRELLIFLCSLFHDFVLLNKFPYIKISDDIFLCKFYINKCFAIYYWVSTSSGHILFTMFLA